MHSHERLLVFFLFRRTDKIDSVMKELMGQCPQNFGATTASADHIQ